MPVVDYMALDNDRANILSELRSIAPHARLFDEQLESIKAAEDRKLFKELLESIDEPAIEGKIVTEPGCSVPASAIRLRLRSCPV